MLLPVTALYGTVLTAMVCGLSIRAAMGRLRRVAEDELHRRVRAHGNLSENVPYFVLGLGLLELGGASVLGLHLCGAAFVAARLSHAVAISKNYGPSLGRQVGIVATWTLLGIVWNWAALLHWGVLPTA